MSDSINDHALEKLLPHLTEITAPTLWYADENALALSEQLPAHPLLTVITNRYDIFQSLKQNQHQVVFSDFNPEDYELEQPIEKIIYRISKEKALVHHIFNQANQLLSNHNSLVISGLKNEGIKTYGDKLKKIMGTTGRLKKTGVVYTGEYVLAGNTETFDDQDYENIQTIATNQTTRCASFCSKPGVFGWDKVDQGTELLLEALKTIKWEGDSPKNVMDLGCGYGWIFMNIDDDGFEKIVATDNNAAALLCAQKNAQSLKTPIDIVASNCADNVHEKFDLILCNPPFHRGFDHHQVLTELFLKQCSHHLQVKGTTLIVVNSFIDIEKSAKKYFSSIKTINKTKSFKVLQLQK